MAISISSPQGHISTAHRLGITPETIAMNEAIIRTSILNISSSDKDNKTSEVRDENLLTVSPYDERPHLLDLRTLDTANQLLARALVGLRCLRGDYATAPYHEIFNWPEVVKSVREMAELSEFEWEEFAFYIVVFRSQIPPTTVYADLGVLDKAAHAEATESGGFLK
jgi:hypothetical protein